MRTLIRVRRYNEWVDPRRPRPAALCLDCGVDVAPEPSQGRWQWYMVRDAVWSAAGTGHLDGYLCVLCLEARLGRPLTGADFSDLPLNRPGFKDDTPRLAELKAAAWASR